MCIPRPTDGETEARRDEGTFPGCTGNDRGLKPSWPAPRDRSSLPGPQLLRLPNQHCQTNLDQTSSHSVLDWNQSFTGCKPPSYTLNKWDWVPMIFLPDFPEDNSWTWLKIQDFAMARPLFIICLHLGIFLTQVLWYLMERYTNQWFRKYQPNSLQFWGHHSKFILHTVCL